MEPLNETQVIQNLRQTKDPSAQYYAAWWLGKMRSQHPDAIPLLLRALEALDVTPIDPEQRGVALNAIRALGLLRDTRAEQPLLPLLHSNDYTVREEVVRTLGAMGSCGAAEGIRALLASGLEGISDLKGIFEGYCLHPVARDSGQQLGSVPKAVHNA
ncbi:HEAT repeat domain-containing protein [Synechococcus sp. AH-736-A19]|nr:HEAT repeat domain-containing protein [Synechococcus sp. AH-736-A19]